MDEQLDRTLEAVGPRLKSLRMRRNITLTDLAEETGISTSTLSRLEAGLRRPTLEQLLPLARAYGVTLDELVDAPPTGDPRINLRPIANRDGSTIIPLTRRTGGIQAYKFVLRTGSDTRSPPCVPMRATTGFTSSMAGSAWSSANTTSSSNQEKWPSSTPAPHIGSGRPNPALPSSSASSASRVSVPTFVQPTDRPEVPAQPRKTNRPE